MGQGYRTSAWEGDDMRFGLYYQKLALDYIRAGKHEQAREALVMQDKMVKEYQELFRAKEKATCGNR
jgi:hypothetical protein